MSTLSPLLPISPVSAEQLPSEDEDVKAAIVRLSPESQIAPLQLLHSCQQQACELDQRTKQEAAVYIRMLLLLHSFLSTYQRLAAMLQAAGTKPGRPVLHGLAWGYLRRSYGDQKVTYWKNLHMRTNALFDTSDKFAWWERALASNTIVVTSRTQLRELAKAMRGPNPLSVDGWETLLSEKRTVQETNALLCVHTHPPSPASMRGGGEEDGGGEGSGRAEEESDDQEDSDGAEEESDDQEDSDGEDDVDDQGDGPGDDNDSSDRVTSSNQSSAAQTGGAQDAAVQVSHSPSCASSAPRSPVPQLSRSSHRRAQSDMQVSDMSDGGDEPAVPAAAAAATKSVGRTRSATSTKASLRHEEFTERASQARASSRPRSRQPATDDDGTDDDGADDGHGAASATKSAGRSVSSQKQDEETADEHGAASGDARRAGSRSRKGAAAHQQPALSRASSNEFNAHTERQRAIARAEQQVPSAPPRASPLDNARVSLASAARQSVGPPSSSSEVPKIEVAEPLQQSLPFHPRVRDALAEQDMVIVKPSALDHQFLFSNLNEAVLRQDSSGARVAFSMNFGCANNNGTQFQWDPNDQPPGNSFSTRIDLARRRDIDAGCFKPAPSVAEVMEAAEEDWTALTKGARQQPPPSMRDRVYIKDVSETAKLQEFAGRHFFPRLMEAFVLATAPFSGPEHVLLKAAVDAQLALAPELSNEARLFHAARVRKLAGYDRAAAMPVHPLFFPWLQYDRRALSSLHEVAFDGVSGRYYLYVKNGFQFFNLHVEQMLFPFIHHQLEGTSHWFILPHTELDKLHKLAADVFCKLYPAAAGMLTEDEQKIMGRALLYSKQLFPSREMLRKHEIAFRELDLTAGQVLMAFGGCAHFGMSTSLGQTVAVATNFATADWIERGLPFVLEHFQYLHKLHAVVGKLRRDEFDRTADAQQLMRLEEMELKSHVVCPPNVSCGLARWIAADMQTLNLEDPEQREAVGEYADAADTPEKRALILQQCQAIIDGVHKTRELSWSAGKKNEVCPCTPHSPTLHPAFSHSLRLFKAPPLKECLSKCPPVTFGGHAWDFPLDTARWPPQWKDITQERFVDSCRQNKVKGRIQKFTVTGEPQNDPACKLISRCTPSGHETQGTLDDFISRHHSAAANERVYFWDALADPREHESLYRAIRSTPQGVLYGPRGFATATQYLPQLPHGMEPCLKFFISSGGDVLTPPHMDGYGYTLALHMVLPFSDAQACNLVQLWARDEWCVRGQQAGEQSGPLFKFLKIDTDGGSLPITTANKDEYRLTLGLSAAAGQHTSSVLLTRQLEDNAGNVVAPLGRTLRVAAGQGIVIQPQEIHLFTKVAAVPVMQADAGAPAAGTRSRRPPPPLFVGVASDEFPLGTTLEETREWLTRYRKEHERLFGKEATAKDKEVRKRFLPFNLLLGKLAAGQRPYLSHVGCPGLHKTHLEAAAGFITEALDADDAIVTKFDRRESSLPQSEVLQKRSFKVVIIASANCSSCMYAALIGVLCVLCPCAFQLDESRECLQDLRCTVCQIDIFNVFAVSDQGPLCCACALEYGLRCRLAQRYSCGGAGSSLRARFARTLHVMNL
jgi:hypothetical protein